MVKEHSEKFSAKISNDNNYFRGFLYCGLCGREIVRYFYNPYDLPKGNYFHCAGQENDNCKTDVITESELEKAIIEYFSLLETNEEQDAQAVKINKARAAIIATLQDKINDLEKKDKEITDLWHEKVVSFEDKLNIAKALKRRSETILKAIEQLTGIEYATTKEEIISIFKVSWRDYFHIEKRRFLFNHINKISVLKELIPGKEQGICKIVSVDFNKD